MRQPQDSPKTSSPVSLSHLPQRMRGRMRRMVRKKGRDRGTVLMPEVRSMIQKDVEKLRTSSNPMDLARIREYYDLTDRRFGQIENKAKTGRMEQAILMLGESWMESLGSSQ